MENLISVVIPTFNSEKTILRCLNSVFNQTYKNIEIIICDDCSTDKTQTVLRTIKDSRVSIYYLESNSGAAAARNKAMQYAKGEFIAFLDSDDEWLPHKLENQILYFENKKVGLVFSGAKIIKNNRQIVYFKPNKEHEVDSKNKFFMGEIKYLTPTAIFRSECIDKIGYMAEDLLRNQDFDFFLRILVYYELRVTLEPLAVINLNTKKRLYYKYAKAIQFYESERIQFLKENFTQDCINIFFARMYRNLACSLISHRKYVDSCKSIKKSIKYSSYYIFKPSSILLLFKSIMKGAVFYK